MRTESERQAAVLESLWAHHPREPGGAPNWHEHGPVLSRGMAAYQGNASAIAERALAAAYPTVQALLGDEALALLARQLWRHHPPTEGDLTQWGQALPGWLANLPEVEAWPYLPDCARLDWARHVAEHAPDTEVDMASLALLGSHDPSVLHLELRPGLSMIRSNWPVVTVWETHQIGDLNAPHNVDALARLQQSLAQPEAETAVVWRPQWRAEVCAMPESMSAWMMALGTAARAEGATMANCLSTLLDQAAPDFDLPQWLALALQKGWLWRVSTTDQFNGRAD